MLQMYEVTSLKGVVYKGTDLSNYGNESSKLKQKQSKTKQKTCILVIYCS